MNDRELLVAAAKAAGMESRIERATGDVRARFPGSGDAFPVWNPLVDDGDALRLAVKLRLLPIVEEWSDGPWVFVPSQPGNAEPFVPDGYAATRRAIVRSAAAMASP